MYYFGNDYKYSVITNDKIVKIPIQGGENGNMDVPTYDALKRHTKSIVKRLPKIQIQGVNLPKTSYQG